MTWDVDTWFHLMRVHEITTAFNHGHLPNLVNFYSFKQLGQATNAMYPSFSLWPFLYILRLVPPIIQWYSLSAIFLFIGLVLTSFYARKLTDNEWLITLFSIVTIVSPGIFTNLHNGSFGMFVSAMFLPSAILALTFSRRQIQYAWLYLAVPIAIIAITHLMTLTMLVAYLGLFAIVELIKTRNLKQIVLYLKSGMLAILLAAPIFIVPIIKFQSDIVGVIPRYLVGAPVLELVKNSVKAIYSSDSYTYTGVLPLIGLVLIAICLFNKKIDWQTRYFGIISLIMFILMTNIFPWPKLTQLLGGIVQYPEWRVAAFMVPTVFVTLFLLAIDLKIEWKLKGKVLVYSLIAIFTILPFLQMTMYQRHLNATEELWQVQKQYSRETTILNEDSFKDADFYNVRQYVDYSPVEAMANAELVNRHGVTMGQSIALINGTEVTVTKHPTKDYRGIVLKFPKKVSGKVDIPIWNYEALNYDIPAAKSYQTSKLRGSLLVDLKNPTRQIVIKSVKSNVYTVTIWIMTLSWLGIAIAMIINKRKK